MGARFHINEMYVKDKLTISLLSNLNNPLSGHIIRSILAYGVPIDSILLDAKPVSDEYLEKVWAQRTNKQWEFVSFHEFAREKIPFFFVENHSSESAINLVKERGINLLVNAGTPRILRSGIIQAPSYGVLNCHPSILPDYRGCSAVEWAILNDDKVGNTIHFMTEEIDEGPIAAQETISFLRSDNYHDIRIKVYQHGVDMMAKQIRYFVEMGVDFSLFETPSNGKYYKPIDDESLSKVITKLEKGKYIHQL